jgi:hypothetical protein
MSLLNPMHNARQYDARLWRLLEEEKLTDLSQFHQPGFTDEVPLYTRKRDIRFLPADNANEILLGFALKLLRSIIAYQRHRSGYLAAITAWSTPADPIVPNLFVWCGSRRELKPRLALHEVATPFGKQIRRLVSRLRLEKPFTVLEESATVPNMTRVFIGPAQPPYPGFVMLDRLRKAARLQDRGSESSRDDL